MAHAADAPAVLPAGEALLHYNGFEVEAVYGDFEGGPLQRDSDTMVWHARAAKRITSRSRAR